MKVATTKDDILKADDVVMEAIEVPAWDCIVYIREMGGTARERWETRASESNDTIGAIGRLLIEVICDQEGRLLFGEDDVNAIGEKACGPLIMLFEKACELNTLTAAEVDELAGNSASDPNGVSG